MAGDDWFRATIWDDASRDAFERRLAKQKGWDAAQSLRIQGVTLLGSDDPRAWAPGLVLLERVICDHPDQHSEVAGAHVSLGEHDERLEDFERAKEHFRRSVEAERLAPNWHHGADLKLAALLAADETGDGDAEATEMLDRSISRRGAVFAQLQLRYLLARARVESRGPRADLAAAYASGVLRLLSDAGAEQDADPLLTGLVAELRDIVAGGDPQAVSPLVDEFRDVDGTVQWIWPLVSQLHAAAAPGEALPASPQRATAACEAELRAAGFKVFDLWSWSVKEAASAADARRAAEILLRRFAAEEDSELRATIARTLRDPRVRKLATQPMLDAYRELHSPELRAPGPPLTDAVGVQRRLKEALGNALATLARDPEFDQIAALIRDDRHGGDRAYLFWDLHHMRDPRAVDLCLELLDDPEVGMNALHALGSRRSRRARPALTAIAAEPFTCKRDDASERQRTRVQVAQDKLAKLDQAEAAGRARP